ncbi:MAG: ATP-binding protein [Gaiellaceae bacterium]|jgi:hypothetical protein
MADPRSVAELLPKSLNDLTFEDVEAIVHDAGKPGESLYLEWKIELTNDGIAKACAAFANTYGGFLIVGVDDDGKVVGFTKKPGDEQLWVKEILRSRLVPMPAFRARFLARKGEKERGVLLVLVEESSTTPHLLAKAGTIYVRSPRSSDPVPITDQARLVDLVRRGREARDHAVARATESVSEHRFTMENVGSRLYTLGLAPTGSSSDAVEDVYRGPELLESVKSALHKMRDLTLQHGDEIPASARLNWSLRRVTYEHKVSIDRPMSIVADGIALDSDCVVTFDRCDMGTTGLGGALDPYSPPELSLDCEILPWFRAALENGRELILSLGGHGDLRIALWVKMGDRTVHFAESEAKGRGDELLSYWTQIDSDQERDESLVERVKMGILRSLNVKAGP